MLNPNIAMLENVISAAVSTQYKEVPPTEEEFLALAQTMRANMSAFPVTDEDFTEILVRLRASIVIRWMSACTSMIEIHLINRGFLPEEQIWTFSSGIDIKNIWRK